MEKTAAYFEVGDFILYGKYKNKKGRIVRFTQDDKGNPQVEIEPVPKGRKQNKTMGLFKIWKQKDMEKAASNVAFRKIDTLISTRVASRYMVAYQEREGRRTMEIHEMIVKAAKVLKTKHSEFERARRRSKKRAAAGKEVEKVLKLTRDIVKSFSDNMDEFIAGYIARSKDADSMYTRLNAQWRSWKRQIKEFLDSADKYLKLGDPEEYFWPVGAVDDLINITGSLAGTAFQLTVPELKAPEVHDKESVLNKLRAYATGKVVGIARKIVGELGRDKQSVSNFVIELLEDVNMHKVTRKLERAVRYDPSDEAATQAATMAGRMVSWDPAHALGLAYAALKAVGNASLGETILDAAADDRYFNYLKKTP